MISLGTTQKIQLKIAETGRDIDVLAAWVDTSDDLPASDETLISTSGTDTATDIIAAPSSGVRQVDFINVYNRDSDSTTVTVQQYNSTGTVTSVLFKAALAPGETLVFTSKTGWQRSAVAAPEELSSITNAACNTSGYTTVTTLTLTVGTWVVSAGGMGGGGGSCVSHGLKLFVKGSCASAYGDDITQVITNSSYGNQFAFPSRVVTIAAGDADKTVYLQSQTSGGNGQCYGSIRALRVA